jgi:hypothetical protein
MEGLPEGKPQKARMIDWRVAAKRARKPAPWLGIIAIAAIAFLALEAYVWTPQPEEPVPYYEGFRFDAVYMLERGTEGNTSTFAVSPWFSNPGPTDMHGIRFVVYAIQNDRRIASQEVSANIGELASRHTRNASIEFQLNNTRDYSIEILVLEGDYLIAHGYGSVGWVRYYDQMNISEFRTMADDSLQAGSFTFEYPGK